MQINAAHVNLITSCLRFTAMMYEAREKQLTAQFKREEAFNAGAYARACADLADQFDREGGRKNHG